MDRLGPLVAHIWWREYSAKFLERHLGSLQAVGKHNGIQPDPHRRRKEFYDQRTIKGRKKPHAYIDAPVDDLSFEIDHVITLHEFVRNSGQLKEAGRE